MISVCLAVQTLLPEYLEDTLDEEQATFARQHLANCTHCRGVASDYGAIRSFLSSITLVGELGSDFETKLLVRLLREQAAPPHIEHANKRAALYLVRTLRQMSDIRTDESMGHSFEYKEGVR